MAKPVYVPQLGRVLNFPDSATDEQIVSQIRAQLPTAPETKAPEPEHDSSGFFGRLATGLGTSFTDPLGGIASLAYPAEIAKDTIGGRTAAAAKSKMEELAGIDRTKDPTTMQMAGEILGNLAGFAATGWGAGSAAKAVGLAEKGAAWASRAAVAAQGATLGAQSRTDKINQQLAAGMKISPEQQLAAQRMDAVIGLSEVLPMEKFFGPIATLLRKVPASKAGVVEKILESRFSKMARAGGEEALQEVAQNIGNDLVEYNVYNPDVQIGGDLLSNAAAGGGAGMFVEGLVQLAAGRKMRPYRQLAKDIEKEGVENYKMAQQGRVALAAEDLRKNNVQGIVDITKEEIDGLPVFSIKTPDGKTVGQFDGSNGFGFEQAKSAVELYRENTGAKVTLRGDDNAPSVFPVTIDGNKYERMDDIIAARNGIKEKRDSAELYIKNPEMLAKQAASMSITPEFYGGVVKKQVDEFNTRLKKYDEFIDAATKPPKKEDTTKKIETPEPSKAPEDTTTVTESGGTIEMRPSATADQLDELKKELFGESINVRDMTPEQKVIWEKKRDERYPPAPVVVSPMSAGPVSQKVEPVRSVETAEEPKRGRGEPAYIAPKSLQEAIAAGPRVAQPTKETSEKFRAVYDGIIKRMSIISPDVGLRLREFIDDAGPDALIKGSYNVDSAGKHSKGIIDLATGIYDPKLSEAQLLQKLLEVTNHEIIHALRANGLIKVNEWKMLAKAAQSAKVPGKAYTYLDKAQAVYTPSLSKVYEDPDAVIEEAVAEMYKDWTRNASKEVPQNSRGIFNRITEFFRRIFRTLRDTKYEEVFKAIESGDVGKRTGEKTSDAGVRFSAAPAVDSDEFKKWFAGSQMVDRAGRPMVFYTGTSKDKIFTSFKENDRGTWVTTSPETASQYAIDNDSKGLKQGPGWTFEEVNTASRVIPLYVSAKNILDLTEERAYADFVKNNGISDTIDYRKAQAQIGRAAKYKGYDAIKWGPDVWSIFDAKNLKSTMNDFAPGAAESKKFSAAPIFGSEEFKKWFNGSQAVNEDGSPKVFYHGTPRSFKQFGKARSANWRGAAGEEGPFFFAEDPKFANQYAEMKMYAGGDGRDVKTGQKVYPVYLSVKNPFDYENPEHLDRVATEIGEGFASGKYTIADVSNGKYEPGMLQSYMGKTGTEAEKRYVMEALRALRDHGRDGDWSVLEGIAEQKAIRNLGFDGFYVNEMGFKNLAVYKPEQVKSIFNQFKPGTAESKRFSAAPIPTHLEAANANLFAPEPKMTTKDKVFRFFLGETPDNTVLNTMSGPVEISKWKRGAIAARVEHVDSAAFLEHLEKIKNQQDTGNFEREVADYSATVAMAWRRRASQIASSVILKGGISINFARPGDIQSATVKATDSPDKLLEVFRVLSEPGPDGPNGEKRSKSEIFKMYASAMRGIGLKAAGEIVPKELTDQYIRDTINLARTSYPEVVEAYEMYQRFNKNLLTAARDAGVIDSAALARLTRKMDYYGFYREVYQEVLGPTSGIKTAGDFDLRAYKGSEYGGLVNDPMFVILQNTQFWIDSIAKNLAATKAFELTKHMGLSRLLSTAEDPDPTRGEEKQVMFFRKDGVTKRFAVSDPLLVTALGSSDKIDMGRALSMMTVPAQFLRDSITRDPGFMIANLMRDTLSAWITSGRNMTPVIDTLKGLKSAWSNSSSFQALMGYGVVGSYDLAMLGPAELSEKLRRKLAPKNIHEITTLAGANKFGRLLWDKLGVVSEYSDAATRIAIYDAAIKDGASEAEAAFRAIEIMDFSRRGASNLLSVYTKMVPFLNARIQGFDVLYQAGAAATRLVTGNARGKRDVDLGKNFLIRGTILALISTFLEELNDDDEEYKQLDDHYKTGNLLMPLKALGMPGEYIAWPKPFEAGLLFSTIPQQIYKTWKGDASTRETADLFWNQIWGAIAINPVPQALAPIAEIYYNKDSFTGLPLISEGQMRLSPELQYNSRTSSVARMLGGLPLKYNFTSGEWEGVSPTVIDNLIQGYSGTLGSYMLMATSTMMQAANSGPERAPFRAVSDLPVVKRFFIDSETKNPKVVTQAYELFQIADEANRTLGRLKQIGDAEAVMDYVNEHRTILSYKKHIFKLVDTLNKLNARERAIIADKTKSDDEKTEALKNLREMRIRVSSKVAEINKALGR